MRPTKDQTFIDVAITLAKQSTCIRRSVGCVLLNERNEIIGTGYNGVAHGQPHCVDIDPWGRNFHPHACPYFNDDELNQCKAIHAEINALLQCKDVFSIRTCVSTHRPCIACAKALLNTSCERIVFLHDHEDDAPKKLWMSAGRTWLSLETLHG